MYNRGFTPIFYRAPKKRGFTVFFAVLVASLALAIGIAIYDLLLRELELSRAATESQYAIYAADTGAECALYWDLNFAEVGDTDQSAFATSSETDAGDVAQIGEAFCNGQDIVAAAVGSWPQLADGSSATTVFEVLLVDGDDTGPCAVVTVEKNTEDPGDPPETKITSHGRNTCVAGPGQLERSLEVNY